MLTKEVHTGFGEVVSEDVLWNAPPRPCIKGHPFGAGRRDSNRLDALWARPDLAGFKGLRDVVYRV